MAQGLVAPGATPNGVAPAVTAEELREILEYQKILQFRDSVIAGSHPRIKIPPHLAAKSANATRNFSSPTANNVAQRSTPSSHVEDSPSSFFRSPNSNNRAGGAMPIAKPGNSEINPILLQKSDDLIKAEINLQRQRVERALRDQLEKQRIATKAALQTSESLPNFDISEVLSNAQAIVPPATAAEAQPAMIEETPASDSFDENTFYSSQHDSSDWSNSSQGQREPVEVQSGGFVSVGGHSGESQSVQSRDQPKVVASASLSTDNHPAAHKQHSQHLTDAADPQKQRSAMDNTVLNFATRDSPHRQPEASSTSSKQNSNRAIVQSTSGDLLRQAFEGERAPPLEVRAHNLSPVAPQPARVSPLATAREPPILRETVLADNTAPAQVAALRNQTGVSSTDTSPKGGKVSEKKKGKKKKRKAKDSTDTSDSPYIKPEPKSPSPYAVAPVPRPPQKRQRQSDQYAAELNYDEPRLNEVIRTQRSAQEPYEEVQESRAYQRVEEPYEPAFGRPLPPVRRIEDTHRRTASDAYARQPQSSAFYSTPSYAHREAHSARAVSNVIVDRRVEDTRYQKEPVMRTVMRPDADRERSRSPIMRDGRSPAMGPPRQAVRIVRDEFGNEYYDPTPPRQSVAPPVRYREEIVYERPRVRGEVYEEDGVLYRRSPPPTAIPRRVVTQPEYAMAPPSGYRSYREREYSVRPSGEEYAARRQVYEEPIREYASRAQSIRPEVVRYEVRNEPEYVSRAPIPREDDANNYARAASIRPEQMRYETREEVPREYAVPRVQALRDENTREFTPRAGTARPDAVRYTVREDREYASRAPVVCEEPYARPASIRPDTVRYEAPREYIGRMQSVRPEAPPREYASSVRPEVRQREFSVRPVESLNRREPAPVAKGERYYEEAPGQRQPPIAFIERPRAREASVMVYENDTRREVYR